jgi:hypothetical protein
LLCSHTHPVSRESSAQGAHTHRRRKRSAHSSKSRSRRRRRLLLLALSRWPLKRRWTTSATAARLIRGRRRLRTVVCDLFIVRLLSLLLLLLKRNTNEKRLAQPTLPHGSTMPRPSASAVAFFVHVTAASVVVVVVVSVYCSV